MNHLLGQRRFDRYYVLTFDGVDFAECLKRSQIKVNIMLATAVAMTTYAILSLKIGAHLYFNK